MLHTHTFFCMLFQFLLNVGIDSPNSFPHGGKHLVGLFVVLQRVRCHLPLEFLCGQSPDTVHPVEGRREGQGTMSIPDSVHGRNVYVRKYCADCVSHPISSIIQWKQYHERDAHSTCPSQLPRDCLCPEVVSCAGNRFALTCCKGQEEGPVFSSLSSFVY